MIVLAPMQGLTEVLFRKTYHECFPNAFDYAISPFISLTHGNLSFADKKISDLLPVANTDSIPVIPQILGNEAPEFIALTCRLADLGYNRVDWNLGCPVRRVAAKKRGSGLLSYPDKIRQILDVVIPAIPIPLSIKVRLGYNSPKEIESVAPVLNDYPLACITIHPRIGRQMYGGHADLDAFGSIAPTIIHPIIYNGDIFTTTDYARILQRFPFLKDIMIGRGALYDPLLPLKIREKFPEMFGTRCDIPIQEEACKSFIRQLIDAINEYFPKEQAKIRKTKEYWGLLSRSLPFSEQEKRRVLHACDLETIRSLIFEMTQ